MVGKRLSQLLSFETVGQRDRLVYKSFEKLRDGEQFVHVNICVGVKLQVS